MRIALCLWMVALASGCSFAPCDDGCATIIKQASPHQVDRAFECTSVGQQHTEPLINTCQTSASPVSSLTPTVCSVNGSRFGYTAEATCLSVGTCTVSVQAMDNVRHCECKCPTNYRHMDTCSAGYDCTPSPDGGFCVHSSCVPFPCKATEMCIHNAEPCVTEPCPQFRCEPMVTCLAMPTCDEGDTEVKTCPADAGCYHRTMCSTTITCLQTGDPCSPNPCKSGVCRRDLKTCVASPCPQYTCEGEAYTCQARPTCDNGLVAQGMECPQDAGCYKRSLCGNDILCIGDESPCCEAMPSCPVGKAEGPPCTRAELAEGTCQDVEYCCAKVSCRSPSPSFVKGSEAVCGSWYTRVPKCSAPDLLSRVCVEKEGVSCMLNNNPCSDVHYPCPVYGTCVAEPKICVDSPCPQYHCSDVVCAALPNCDAGDRVASPGECVDHPCYPRTMCGTQIYCRKQGSSDDEIPGWALALVITGCALILALTGVLLYLVLFKLKVPADDASTVSGKASFPDNVKRVSVSTTSSAPHKESGVVNV